MSSCPNCGFDLDRDGRCTVCGYESRTAGHLETVGAMASDERQGSETIPEPDTRGAVSRYAQAQGASRRRAQGVNLPLVVAGGAALFALFVAGALVLRNGGVASTALTNPAPGGPPAPSAASPASSPQTSTSLRGNLAPTAPQGGSASETPDARSPGSANVSKRKISRVGFSAPIGASPVSIRATHPVDLYSPATQPAFDITTRTAFPPLTSEHAYVRWMLGHTHQQEKYLRERWIRAMKAVHRHLLVHRRVLMAFLLTPREWFVRSYNLKKAYANTALPIGYGQTISGPDLVAHMTDALDPQPNQRVLEIGTGSGYQSALLSQLSNYVYTIEIVRPLARQTNEIYLEHTKALPEYANIHRRLADGYYGWPAYAPFDRIIVTTGIDHIPPDLLKELKPGGIMVIPIGPPTGQTILKITKTVGKNGRIHLERQNLYPGITDIFVPFTASGGGTHDKGSSRR